MGYSAVKELNSNSLPAASSKADNRVAVPYYIVLFPNGDSDDAHYSNHIEAWNSLCDADDIQDLARAHFHEEGWELDETHLADYISGNVRALGEELGYRVEPNLKWRKS
jgi:hypothetical protein